MGKTIECHGVFPNIFRQTMTKPYIYIHMEHVCGDDDQPSLSFTQLSFLSFLAVSGGSSHPIQTL
jgi:hypothetical protein